MSLLRTEGLRASYGQVDVLLGIDIEVNEGEMVVILGANGAGKTTTMRAVSGTVARSGSIIFDGQEIVSESAESIVRLGIAHVPQGRGTFADLTVEENLRIGAYIRKDSVESDIERWYETFPRLGERKNQKAGSLSGGEQQMLAIARALMSRPRLLLCDEPSLGLAPLVTQELFGVLKTLNQEEGLSVLLVEQNANLALKVAHRVYLLETGQVVASGSAESIAGDEEGVSRRLIWNDYCNMFLTVFLSGRFTLCWPSVSSSYFVELGISILLKVKWQCSALSLFGRSTIGEFP
jgi:branched-chain amino acid transport system ATP-binding protein